MSEPDKIFYKLYRKPSVGCVGWFLTDLRVSLSRIFSGRHPSVNSTVGQFQKLSNLSKSDAESLLEIVEYELVERRRLTIDEARILAKKRGGYGDGT